MCGSWVCRNSGLVATNSRHCQHCVYYRLVYYKRYNDEEASQRIPFCSPGRADPRVSVGKAGEAGFASFGFWALAHRRA